MKNINRKTPATLLAFLFLLLSVSGNPVHAESKPTLMIIMDEKVMGVFGTTGFEVPTQAEISLMQHFSGMGFNVVDPKTVKRNITQAKGLRLLEGDDMAAAAVGLQHGAQYSIIGTAISKPGGAKLYGTQMQSIHATLTARVVRNSDARVIATASASAAQAHIDEVRGGAMAIEKAAQQLAQQLSGQIPAAGAGAGDRTAGQEHHHEYHRAGLLPPSGLPHGLPGKQAAGCRQRGTAHLYLRHRRAGHCLRGGIGRLVAQTGQSAVQGFSPGAHARHTESHRPACGSPVEDRARTVGNLLRQQVLSLPGRSGPHPSPVFLESLEVLAVRCIQPGPVRALARCPARG